MMNKATMKKLQSKAAVSLLDKMDYDGLNNMTIASKWRDGILLLLCVLL